MKKYEIGFIVRPTIGDDKIKEVVERLKSIYTEAGCQIIDEVDLGVKELAYEIQKHTSGYYFFFVAQANKEVNDEFERICRISDDVIRFIVLNVDDVEANTLDILR